MGPGSYDQMTIRAAQALQEAQVIAGYSVYVDLVKPHFPDKEYLVTPMRKEADRCRMAIDAACAGKSVAMISSGDAGVYGMAGLIYELAQGRDLQIEVIPGVTAALSGGAVLGAPLTHDFAVISLSDLLTLGKNRGPAGYGGPGGFQHCALQSLQHEAGGLSQAGGGNSAAPQGPRNRLRRGAQHRPGWGIL